MRARPWSPPLPAYLNALAGKGVHVITVNDYLADYQSELMGRVYRVLGLSVGCILAQMTPEERREQYAADITYGTNNEFGFDYLRDNMAWSAEELVQRGHYFAIVDEVDSILIDEARTPLIISGPSAGRREVVRGVREDRAERLRRRETSTTRSTRRSAPSASSSRASRRSRTTSASTTSTSASTPR